MADKLLPCKCGYSGALMGTSSVFLQLSCPECSHYAEAFALDGLATAWNKSVEAKP
jgi:hypothetical protein